MPEEKRERKKNGAKMRTLWVSERNIKRLRKLRLIPKEPDDSVLDRMLNKVEKVGLNE